MRRSSRDVLIDLVNFKNTGSFDDAIKQRTLLHEIYQMIERHPEFLTGDERKLLNPILGKYKESYNYTQAINTRIIEDDFNRFKLIAINKLKELSSTAGIQAEIKKRMHQETSATNIADQANAILMKKPVTDDECYQYAKEAYDRRKDGNINFSEYKDNLITACKGHLDAAMLIANSRLCKDPIMSARDIKTILESHKKSPGYDKLIQAFATQRPELFKRVDPSSKPLSKDMQRNVDQLNNAKLNPYELLGVSENASQEEIERAYRKASVKVHPDHIQTEKGSRFLILGVAKAVLLDENAKKHFSAPKQSNAMSPK